VAFTDVFQLICIFFGLIFAIPFMATSHNVDIPLRSSNLTMFMDQEQPYSKFFGKLDKEDAGVWVKDDYITFITNGITFTGVASGRAQCEGSPIPPAYLTEFYLTH